MIEQPPAHEAPSQDAHLRLLTLIEQHPEYSQRRLAEALGVSLGKAHYLLMALFDKGLVKAGKFSRNPARLHYVYALTPAGITHRLQLAKSFLRRKEQEYRSLRSEIEHLRATLDAEGANSQSSGDLTS